MEHLHNTIGLTPRTLLDANIMPDAPLHNEFDWCDVSAAEKYRLQQASHIIRSISVQKTDGEDKSTVRAFFKVYDNEATYRSITAIFEDSQSREALLSRAIRELKAFKNKYEALCELSSVFDCIDAVEADSVAKMKGMK
jgi:hypothetical protein